MSKRLEAAMTAHLTAPRTRGVDTSGPMRAALEAADAVMFADDAIERAAKAEHDMDWGEDGDWDGQDSWVKDNYRKGVRVIIAALKGDS